MSRLPYVLAGVTLAVSLLASRGPPGQRAARAAGDDRRGVTRSMVVDQDILSLSQIGLEIHELADLDVAATLSWAKVQQKPALAR